MPVGRPRTIPVDDATLLQLVAEVDAASGKRKVTQTKLADDWGVTRAAVSKAVREAKKRAASI